MASLDCLNASQGRRGDQVQGTGYHDIAPGIDEQLV